MRNDIVTLITLNQSGIEIKEEKKQVFAEIKSVNRSEFYASYGVGLTPKWVININPDDYNMSKFKLENGANIYATQVEIDGTVFSILRTYQKDSNNIEITVG